MLLMLKLKIIENEITRTYVSQLKYVIYKHVLLMFGGQS